MATFAKTSINKFDLSHFLADLFATLWVWNFRSQSRHQLVGMDARLLEDMGISRKAANAEATKAFWQ